MPIFPILILLFFTIPLVEIYLLIKVGSEIGPLWTVFLVILTAVIGSVLIRIQGFSLLMQSRQQLTQGQLPTDAVFSGACLLVAGALLLTPGFFTDFIGFLLLTPILRSFAYKYLLKRVKTRTKAHFGFEQSTRRQSSDDSIIEGEFREEQDSDKNTKKLP